MATGIEVDHTFRNWCLIHEQRRAILDEISEMKRMVREADGPRREELQAQIRRIGELIEYIRNAPEGDDYYKHETLAIQAVQFANRERHQNRLWVKFYSARLKQLKKQLQQLNRFCSSLETQIQRVEL